MIHYKDGVLLVAVMLFLYMDSHHWFKNTLLCRSSPLGIKV